MVDPALDHLGRFMTQADITQVIADRTESLIIERLLVKKGLTVAGTPKLNGLTAAFDKFTARVEAAADSLHKRMDNVGSFTEGAVEKFGGAVEQIQAKAQAIDDAANQMTNGGPPLDESQK